jgi:hypothetical protein
MMKKKILILALVLTLFTIFSASAYTAAIGAEFAVSGLGTTGTGTSGFITFRLPKFPMVFGLGGNMNSSSFHLGIMADWWLVQGNLVSFINYYVGPGVFGSFGNNYFDAGLRVPLGLNAFPIKPLELFIELAPSFTILSSSGVSFSWSGLQTGFGFRFWF